MLVSTGTDRPATILYCSVPLLFCTLSIHCSRKLGALNIKTPRRCLHKAHGSGRAIFSYKCMLHLVFLHLLTTEQTRWTDQDCLFSEDLFNQGSACGAYDNALRYQETNSLPTSL